MASGLSSFARIVSGSFAASIATTIWPNLAVSFQGDMAANLGQIPTILSGGTGAGLSLAQGESLLNNMVNGQALMRSMLTIFRLSSVLILLLIPIIWLAKRSMSDGGGHSGGE